MLHCTGLRTQHFHVHWTVEKRCTTGVAAAERSFILCSPTSRLCYLLSASSGSAQSVKGYFFILTFTESYPPSSSACFFQTLHRPSGTVLQVSIRDPGRTVVSLPTMSSSLPEIRVPRPTVKDHINQPYPEWRAVPSMNGLRGSPHIPLLSDPFVLHARAPRHQNPTRLQDSVLSLGPPEIGKERKENSFAALCWG